MKLIHIADTHLGLVGEVFQNLDNEKNPQGFFEREGFAEPDEASGGRG